MQVQPLQVQVMEFTPEKIALIAAAIAVVFWPQIWPAIQRFTSQRSAAPAPAAGANRSRVVTDLLRLQDSARALGKPAAADLIGSAIVELVSETKPGAKK